MKLLILTQKVDINDDVLGFFHGWLEKFSQKFEKIIIICLQKGEYNLPENIAVLSLGKTAKKENIFAARAKCQGKVFAKMFSFFAKIKYGWNFYKYIWRERKNYDCVFVHMNQEYVLLGGLFWKVFGKKIFMWRNHKNGNLFTKMAVALCYKVFYTSEFSFTARFRKSKIMPVGIDMEKFKVSEAGFKKQNRILSLGRISPVKNIHILIEVANKLDRVGVDFILNIAGEPLERDEEYYKKIKEMAKNAENKGKIRFLGKIPNYKTPEIYAQNDIFVNLTKSGSMDKTIIEAMACGLLVLACNKSFEGILPKEFTFNEDNALNLAEKIEYALKMPHNEKMELALKFRKWVDENHSLDLLVKKLIHEFQE